MKLKQKLLEAVEDIDTCELDEQALVDLLVAKIKSQQKEIEKLEGANGREQQRLYDETMALLEERKRLKSDPRYGAYGLFYFIGEKDAKFCLNIQGGQILELFERKKDTDYLMQKVSLTEWEAQ